MESARQTLGRKGDALAFTKMAGGGNDFVVIDNRDGVVTDPAELTRVLSTRALSVGADGLILVEHSTRAPLRIRYWNSDGSHGEFCGNGTRCAARFALINGIAGHTMALETDAGIVSAEVEESGSVSISMPPPHALKDLPLRVGEQEIKGTSIIVGVPHYVIFLRDDLFSHDIVPLGRAIRQHRELQPAGANVNFVVVRDRHSIELRTYERGVEAETLSCGSGTVAAVSVAAMFGKVDSPVKVLTRSGITLEVSFKLDAGSLSDVRLKGDARVIYRGTLDAEAVEGFDPDFVRDPARAESKVAE